MPLASPAGAMDSTMTLGLGDLVRKGYTSYQTMFCPVDRNDMNRHYYRRRFWEDDAYNIGGYPLRIHTPGFEVGPDDPLRFIGTNGKYVWVQWWSQGNYYNQGSYKYSSYGRYDYSKCAAVSGSWYSAGYTGGTGPTHVKEDTDLQFQKADHKRWNSHPIVEDSYADYHYPLEGANVLWGSGGTEWWDTDETGYGNDSYGISYWEGRWSGPAPYHVLHNCWSTWWAWAISQSKQ